ncbi:hypothetical protein BC828DRAFT_59758 [Blastocladiella britannica]|nr:hypothetical protein BC828DRAFT_59758 [Blastocladiella britannica]
MQLMTQRPGIRAAQSTAEKLCLQLGTAISKSTLLLPAETRFTRAAEWTYLLLEELQWFAFAFRDISTIAPVFQPALLLWIAPVKDNLATCGIILSALVFAFIAVAAIALAQIDNQRAVSHALALFLAALLHLGNVFQIQLVAILFAGITAQLPLTPMYATALALFACISIAAPFFTAPASPKSHRLMAALMGTPFAITSGSVLVVVATEIFAADRLTLAITGGIVMTARVLYLWLRVPFYNSHVNSARIGLCTGALAALMATTITQFLLSGSLVLTSAQIIAPATICVVAPLVALLANKLQARRRAALVGRWQRIAKPDPWGPHTLMDAASHQAIFRALAQFSSAGKFEHQLAAAKSGFLDLKHGYDHERNVAASDDDGSNLCPPPRQPVPATPSSITKLGPLGILEQGPVKLPERVFSAPWELEFALRFLRKRPTPSQRSLALHMIWKGMQEYPDSNLVRLIAAEYLHLSFGKYPEAMSAVAKISPSHSRSFFTRGVLWTCRQQSVSVQDESPITATSSASKSLAARTQDAHLLSLFALKDFYEVVRTNGGTVRLTSVLARLAKHMRTARTGYDRLLAQDPRNGDVLRLYSIFVAQVEADAARAANLAELAVAEINRENGEHMVDNLNSQGSIGKQSNGTPTMPRSASISSGASSTRAVQLRARLRSLIHARIAAPLLQRFLVSVLAIAFLATVVGGYYSYSMFYQKTLNVINIYSSMRSARNSVLFTIEGVRGLVYSNNLMSAADFKSFNTTLVTKGLTIYNTSLAAMMALAASDPNPAVYRVYRSRASATSSDFAPYDLTANQVLDIVAQGAQLAMQNYPVLGALTPAAVTKVPEMRFLVDNFVTVMAAAKSLLASSMVRPYFSPSRQHAHIDFKR